MLRTGRESRAPGVVLPQPGNRYDQGNEAQTRRLIEQALARQLVSSALAALENAVRVGTGVPSNDLGIDGQFYLRLDGEAGVTACIYHKEADVWEELV